MEWSEIVPGALLLLGSVATLVAVWRSKGSLSTKLLQTTDELQEVYKEYEKHQERTREQYDAAMKEIGRQAESVPDFVDKMRKKMEDAGL